MATTKKENLLKGVKREEYEKVDANNEQFKDTRKHLYLGYSARIIIYGVFCLFIFFLSIYFVIKSIDVSKDSSINYQESSDVDYKVYLKDNDFYQQEYFGKKDKMKFIASLIDKIDVNFKYNFSIDNDISGSYVYKIVGTLQILDSEGAKLFSKDCDLLKDKDNVVKDNKYEIDESVSIDYNYYNNVANEFKSQYGVDTNSNLIIALKLSRSINEYSNINGSEEMTITIPLSQKAISINLNYNDINKKSEVINAKNISINNKYYFVLGIFLFVIFVIIFLRMYLVYIRVKSRKNEYDKYVSRLLREYDRLIGVSSTSPNISESNIYKIKKFSELLDIRDNIKKPIMFYEVSPHNKCYFYIKDNKDIYILTIKQVDLEKK